MIPYPKSFVRDDAAAVAVMFPALDDAIAAVVSLHLVDTE